MHAATVKPDEWPATTEARSEEQDIALRQRLALQTMRDSQATQTAARGANAPSQHSQQSQASRAAGWRRRNLPFSDTQPTLEGMVDEEKAMWQDGVSGEPPSIQGRRPILPCLLACAPVPYDSSSPVQIISARSRAAEPEPVAEPPPPPPPPPLPPPPLG
jgi:hypothetical protein